MSAPFLDQALLKSLLHYNPESGAFSWLRRTDVREQWNGRYAGKTAGYNCYFKGSATPYRMIRIFDWPFLAHRLAVLYMTGRWPTNVVDHSDRDGLNNRWSNLREATRSQNAANSGLPKTNTTGFRGVARQKGRYRAQIRVGGQQVWLGSFTTAEEAACAYRAALIAEFGDFGRAS